MSEQEIPSSVAQRIITKFLMTKGIKPFEILRRFQTQFRDNTLKKTQVYEWHKQFLEGREAVKNESHRRRPRTSVTENICIVGYLLEDDRILLPTFGQNKIRISSEKTRIFSTRRYPAARQCAAAYSCPNSTKN